MTATLLPNSNQYAASSAYSAIFATPEQTFGRENTKEDTK
jgi:hypothetical protein